VVSPGLNGEGSGVSGLDRIKERVRETRSSDLEKTTFGMVFIGSAYSSSETGQNSAISS
jgi:hypothetical protein